MTAGRLRSALLALAARLPWPRRLPAQLTLLVIATLLLSQIGVFGFLADERRHAVQMVEQNATLEQITALVRLLGQTPPESHGALIAAASGPGIVFSLDSQSLLPAESETSDSGFATALTRELGSLGVKSVRIATVRPSLERWHDHGGSHWRGQGDKLAGLGLLAASVALPDGKGWLNVSRHPASPAFFWAFSGALALGLSVLAVALVLVLAVRGITRPVRELADAAEALGRGADVPPLAERGALEIRQATRAFNRMNQRLERAGRERMAILAALSHDLRTPITILRLRAEFIEDPAVRERILETLDDMAQMAESALSFVREGTSREPLRKLDLTALADSVCADLTELGHDARMVPGPRLVVAGRPAALKRALANLVENAVTYGGQARVSARGDGADALLMVEDSGPGVPEDQLEALFEPFYRLETSRNRATGGMGMGLAIVRIILRDHGGDAWLENRAEGGLRAVLRLPQ